MVCLCRRYTVMSAYVLYMYYVHFFIIIIFCQTTVVLCPVELLLYRSDYTKNYILLCRYTR